MGDMADHFLDEVLDYEDDVFEFVHGGLSPEEAYERGIVDENGCVLTGGQRPKTCRFCGQEYLYWRVYESKWKLFATDAPEPHNCRPDPRKEFEPL